jgi:hypothetical protein
MYNFPSGGASDKEAKKITEEGYIFLILGKYRLLSILIRGVESSVFTSTDLVNFFKEH